MNKQKLNKPPVFFTFSLLFLEIVVLFALSQFAERNSWELSNSELVALGMIFYPIFNRMSYTITIIFYGKQK